MTVRETLKKVMPEIYLLKQSKKRNALAAYRKARTRISAKTLKKRMNESSKHLVANINRFTRRHKREKGKKMNN